MKNINGGDRRSYTQLLPAISLPLILIAVAVLYWPARNGGLQFDDRHNLAGLETIVDGNSAIQFIFSGHAGPLGRPVALASFGLQAYAWPDNPEVFLYSNILLHILNGALLAWCLLRLARLRGIGDREGQWVAVVGTALWLVIPLLATSSLFIVQRMTTFSATFMLAGLLGYLVARARLAGCPQKALAGMSVSLVIGTGLAVFSKENGALLPVLVLVIELTLLRAELFKASLATRIWGWLFLAAPLTVLLIFMATKVPYSEQAVLQREFTAGQRLWTEAEILWQYLIHAFLPAPTKLAPFYDGVKASPSPFQPLTFLAIVAWISVVGLALRVRQRRPLLAFAVFWYLAAHLLESTVLNLELYFAHRNYVALIGPVYALVASVWNLKLEKPRAIIAVRCTLAVYVLMLAGSLYSFTTLWGQPLLAAELWSTYKPDSLRAWQQLVFQLYRSGQRYTALQVLDNTYAEDPEHRAAAGIQALVLACSLDPNEDHSKRAEALATIVKTARLHLDVPENLMELEQLLEKKSCSGITLKNVEQIALNALENPDYIDVRIVRHNLHRVLSEVGFVNHDFAKTMTHLEKALHLHPSLDGLRFALQILISAGRPDLGREFIDMVRKHIPRHPVKHLYWVRQLAQLEQQLNEALNSSSPKQAALIDR